MKKSREMTWRSAEGVDNGGSSSQPSGPVINRELCRSMTTREAEISARDIDLTCSQQNRNQSKYVLKNIKKVEKSMTKFFHYNAMLLNAADSGPYY